MESSETRRATRPGSCIRFLSFFVAVSAFLPASRPLMAAYLYDWNSAGVRKITDPLGDTNSYGGPYKPCRDIKAAYHAFDGKHSYFRIDVAFYPVIQSFDEVFGIYIDSVPGGAPASDEHVPQVPGIDLDGKGIDSMFIARFGEWKGCYRRWENGKFTPCTKVLFQHSENAGTTLEWKFEGGFGSNFTWYAASMQPSWSGKKTFDYVIVKVP